MVSMNKNICQILSLEYRPATNNEPNEEILENIAIKLGEMESKPGEFK